MTLIVVALVAALAGIATAFSRADMQHTLRRERAADTSQMFKNYFAPANVPDRVLEVVYMKLSNEIFWGKRFPVRPMDSLEYVYAVGPECPNDLDLLIRELADRCGFGVVPSEVGLPLPTSVEDLVMYLAALYNDNMPKKDKSTLLRSSENEGEQSFLRPISGSRSDADSLMHPLE